MFFIKWTPKSQWYGKGLHRFTLLYPHFNEVGRGYTGFTSSVHLSVPLSIRGPNHVRSSTILAGSISYLHILSINFRKCKIKTFEILANFSNLELWLWIWHESIVWVIIGRRQVFSERRHSSCSNYLWSMLTQCCLVMTYSNIDLGQHWLR